MSSIPFCAAFFATSLDGYICREDGGIDWLERMNALTGGDDCGYQQFFDSCDALVMGRKTFEQVLPFWPYGAKPVLVLSRTLNQLPVGSPPSVVLENAPPAQLVEMLGGRGYRRLYIDGGETIANFLDAGLLREMTITTVPILLGSGRRAFRGGGRERDVALVSSKSFDFGFVQSVYRIGAVVGDAAAPQRK